jgi:holo-[acyl-carrier protein] synthase
MIVGLGMDLVEVARIERAMRNPRFIYRILTDSEREYCKSVQQVAGRWAAKEAIVKAVGLHLTWQHIEVMPDVLGVPKVIIESPHFDPRRLRLHVTITHERTHAAAVAVLERVVLKTNLL